MGDLHSTIIAGLRHRHPRQLVYSEWEPGRPFPAPTTGHRTWLVVSSVGSKLPGAQEGLQDVKSERNFHYLLKDWRFNFAVNGNVLEHAPTIESSGTRCPEDVLRSFKLALVQMVCAAIKVA
jgi:hypothetical protein